jgi:hypothetical protein
MIATIEPSSERATAVTEGLDDAAHLLARERMEDHVRRAVSLRSRRLRWGVRCLASTRRSSSLS